MKLYWVHPDRDETLLFDLPDGARCVQVGAVCCDGVNDRRISFVDRERKTFSCFMWGSSKSAKTSQTIHADWPRISYRITKDADGEYVASVTEANGEAFIVRPITWKAMTTSQRVSLEALG